jgi:hypothetical protein
MVALAHQNLGRALTDLGEHACANEMLTTSLQMDVQMRGVDSWLAGDLDGLACVASVRGDASRAAHLFGAAEAIRKACDYPLEPWARLDFAPYIAKARESLGADGYESAWAEGNAMTTEQVVAYARQGG